MVFSRKGQSPRVSVLVPIYNVERYLPECLDSLLAQSLKDIQIICINDGSTDGSPDILRDYAARDARIEVIDKANSGYGASMNRGLQAARGEYVGIVESDDYASPDMFQAMYRFARWHDCDVVKSNYFEFSDEGGDSFQEPFAGFPYRKVFDPRQDRGILNTIPIIWAAIYRRSMIEDNGIRFNETPGASYQDTSFVHQAWMSARRVAILKKGFLHYRVDNNASSVKSAAKVFAVCDEYALTEDFMARDPQRGEAFADTLNLVKFCTYRWNYNRLTGEARREFGARMAGEFARAREEGTLKEGFFYPEDWQMLGVMMDDYEAFCDDYLESGI